MSFAAVSIRHALSARERMVATAVFAFNEVVAKDHLIAQLASGLTAAEWREVEARLTAQDTRLLDAVADMAAVVEIDPPAQRLTDFTKPSTDPL